MIPLSSVVSYTTSDVASTLNRYNRVRSITLSANIQDGLSLDQALTYLNKLTRATSPPKAIIDYKGQSRDFQNSSNAFYTVFILGILVIFLVLAAQFENFIHPMVILLTAPLALVGGLFALLAFNMSLNIYSQIALVLLLGLATKNGILIVEFTNQLQDQGYASYHALVSTTQLRLRPILRPQSPPLQKPFRLSSQAVQGRNPLYPWDCTVLWCGILNLVEPVYYSKCLCTHCQNSGSPLASTHKLEKALKENKQQPTN